MTATYCTTEELQDYLQVIRQVPDYDAGTTTLETIDSSGTLANGSKIYTAKTKIILGTYTFSYGASAASVTDLTETTHYTFNRDIGEIVITTAGATAIGANNVYGAYKYSKEFKDTLIQLTELMLHQTGLK
jgi:hypothetical protein